MPYTDHRSALPADLPEPTEAFYRGTVTDRVEVVHGFVWDGHWFAQLDNFIAPLNRLDFKPQQQD